MIQKSLKKFVYEAVKSAGIELNGKNPWDIQIYNQKFYTRVLKEGSLGLGESYMDRWWDCDRLDQFMERIISADLESKIKTNKRLLIKSILLKLINLQTKKQSLIVGEKHYDLGNHLFKMMLDSRMNYTCGYWKNARNLDEAQLHKLELTCQKLMLKPGMRILDIGCGFGALAKYAAENYDVKVVGITISKEQCEYAQQNCAGLPIEIRFQDYRDVREKFDRVVSLGMFEHVGQLNYRTYMQIVNQCLRDDGLFLLHSIGSNTSNVAADEWITKYIFPNGMLPSIAQIGASSERLFIMEDWHNFGADYDKTLMAWYSNFKNNWDKLKSRYNDRFYRMWTYYLLSCAGTFRARSTQLWQIVFSKGVKEGYQSLRPSFQTQKSSERSILNV
jgi:cyclopropane-fatty-acyl-phospholipid synthase